jgi:hypothetical protein
MHMPSYVRRALPLLALALLPACRPPAQPFAGPAVADSTAIRRDIAYLASDALEGRGTGTPGNDSAAAYLARRYASLGLRPVAQRFTARSMAAAHAGRPSDLPTQNVVAVLPGRDPALRGEYVVIGAHFDHLGRSSESAQDPEAKDAIRNGADDNASGTAVVLELARLFRASPPRRSIVFVNFTGEELGLLGSQYFVDHSPVPLDSVEAMLNFDMVGRLRDDKLLVYGVATAAELKGTVDSANAASAHPLRITAIGDGFGPSDHSSFYGKNLPVLHFFTDIHEDYHKASDKVEKINAGGAAQIAALAERIARDLADRPGRLTFQRTAAPAMGASSREGSNVYLGSVPDMSPADQPGLRLTGVRPGSPADKGGLMAGDLIVEFAGKPVKDLYSYTDALYAQKPGDTVKVVVVRGGQRMTLTVTLGARGS